MRRSATPRILVQVSVTESDIKRVKNSLLESFDNLRNCSAATPQFLVVYQSSNNSHDTVKALTASDVEITYSSIFSASQARNRGIDYALEHGFDGIIFHDSSLVYSPNFLQLSALALNTGENFIARGAITWKKSAIYQNSDKDTGALSRKWFKVMPYPFIWPHIFPLSSIGNIRFNEKIGPGADTFPNCGEDAEFLLDYLESQPARKILIAQEALVYHPPRSEDLSKQLGYARGQGALYRMLLRRRRVPIHVYISFMLFVTNSTRYAITAGKVGREIFKARWKGYWSKQLTRERSQ